MRQNLMHRSRNLVLAALLSLALPASGIAQDKPLPIDQLRPGQTHIGRANIQDIVDGNTRKTPDNNRKRAEEAAKQGKPVPTPLTELENYKAKMDAGPKLPVVKAPDGTFVMLDGHHRTTAYWSIYDDARDQWNQGNRQQYKSEPEMPTLRVTYDEDQDFTGKNWKQFADWMVDHKKVYFDQEILRKARVDLKAPPLDLNDPDFEKKNEAFIKANDVYLVRTYLPKNFKAMLDSPMRSVVGTVLFELNNAWSDQQEKAKVPKDKKGSLDGSNQIEYVEFLIGDHLRRKGIEAELQAYFAKERIEPPTLKGHEYNKGVLKIIENAIFDSEDERSYLRNSCRPQAESKVCTDTDKTAVQAAVEAEYAIHLDKKKTAKQDARPHKGPRHERVPATAH